VALKKARVAFHDVYVKFQAAVSAIVVAAKVRNVVVSGPSAIPKRYISLSVVSFEGWTFGVAQPARPKAPARARSESARSIMSTSYVLDPNLV
jgi:hypothetical protein